MCIYLPAGLREEGEFADTDGVAADTGGVTADRDGVTTAGSPHLPIQESIPSNCSISSEICIHVIQYIIVWLVNSVYMQETSYLHCHCVFRTGKYIYERTENRSGTCTHNRSTYNNTTSFLPS